MKPFFRRNHLRNYHNAPIRWRGADTDRECGLQARTVNTSACGMCFEAPEKIEPGTEISISLKPEASGARPSGSRATIKARVCWCQTTDDACYDIGVQYLPPDKGNA